MVYRQPAPSEEEQDELEEQFRRAARARARVARILVALTLAGLGALGTALLHAASQPPPPDPTREACLADPACAAINAAMRAALAELPSDS